MTVKLEVTVSFDPSVSHYTGKTLQINDKIAKEYHLKNNSKVGVIWESPDFLKITHRGSIIQLPKNAFKVVTVKKKKISEFSEAN